MSTDSSTGDASTLARTGVAGLDEILGGGLPRGHLYLLQGESGSGKTTLALQFALAGVAERETVLYVSLSETKSELEQVAHSHGWSLDGMEIFDFSTLESDSASPRDYTLFYPSEVELHETTERMLRVVDQLEPQRVILDTISGLRLMADDPLRYRRQIESLRSYLTGRGATVIILDESAPGQPAIQPRSLAHGILEIERVRQGYGPERRRLQVLKLRGVAYANGYHDCRVSTGGFTVAPRLQPTQAARKDRPREYISSGIPELDALLGGGLLRGNNELIMGPAGTGKSSLATAYAIAAAERGENVIFFVFDETLDTFFQRSRGLGFAVDAAADSGRLCVRAVDPAEITPGEFAAEIREQVEERGVSLVVIDTLSGYLYAMPEERFLNLHLHQLLSYLGDRGVTTLFTLVQHGLVGQEVQSTSELSYLTDTLLLLRYFETGGEVRKAISVFKNRAGPHERTIREMILTSEGIQVGEPLREFRGVLTGVPEYLGPERALLGDA